MSREKISEADIVQVLYEHSLTGEVILHSWWTDQRSADKLIESDEALVHVYSWTETGSEHITKRCQCCGTVFCTHRHDFYGFRAGFWCDECFASDDCTVQKTAYSDSE